MATREEDEKRKDEKALERVLRRMQNPEGKEVLKLTNREHRVLMEYFGIR